MISRTFRGESRQPGEVLQRGEAGVQQDVKQVREAPSGVDAREITRAAEKGPNGAPRQRATRASVISRRCVRVAEQMSGSGLSICGLASLLRLVSGASRVGKVGAASCSPSRYR